MTTLREPTNEILRSACPVCGHGLMENEQLLADGSCPYLLTAQIDNATARAVEKAKKPPRLSRLRSWRSAFR